MAFASGSLFPSRLFFQFPRKYVHPLQTKQRTSGAFQARRGRVTGCLVHSIFSSLFGWIRSWKASNDVALFLCSGLLTLRRNIAAHPSRLNRLCNLFQKAPIRRSLKNYSSWYVSVDWFPGTNVIFSLIQLKENRRADKITSGPQSHILEGVSWEEAKKLQDANVTQTGDQVILVGAASKGIIQRNFQHNAMVYKTPYAKNPFDSVSDKEIEEYKKIVERKQKGDTGLFLELFSYRLQLYFLQITKNRNRNLKLFRAVGKTLCDILNHLLCHRRVRPVKLKKKAVMVSFILKLFSFVS